jgi:hypothetical protein
MRKRTEEQWRELIQLHTQSGLTIKAFCIEQKISISNFYKFKKQFKSPLITAKPESAFVALHKPKFEPKPQQSGMIELHCQQAHFTFPDTVSADYLVQLVKGLAV